MNPAPTSALTTPASGSPPPFGPRVAPARAVPPLEPGDHLTLAEFQRRFEAMPDLKKAELIEGVVYMASPVRWKQHAQPHLLISYWLAAYIAATPCVQGGDNATIELDNENSPQPDLTLLIDPARGGQARFTEDGYVAGAPELVVEIAASTASMDLNTKLRVYRRSGVREYLAWRVLDGAVDWFRLDEGEYRPLPLGDDGLLRSRAFPGLWLDPAGLLAGDFARVQAGLQRGLADPSHAAFIAHAGG